jgi:hypothetical protein
MAEGELLTGVRDIDGCKINAAADEARRTMVKVNAALDQLVAHGVDLSYTFPANWNVVGGKTFKINIAITKPPTA